MVVRTAADEHRDKALESINDAIANIAAIVIDRVWGWDEYKVGYYKELRQALNDLLDAQEKVS